MPILIPGPSPSFCHFREHRHVAAGTGFSLKHSDTLKSQTLRLLLIPIYNSLTVLSEHIQTQRNNEQAAVNDPIRNEYILQRPGVDKNRLT